MIASRVHASPQAGATTRPASAPPHRACLECGGALPPSERAPDFCCTDCRTAFNNRLKSRGADLYQLYMAMRYERRWVGPLKLLSLLNRLAAIYHAEDQRERDGRKTWRDPRDVIARRPSLTARILSRGRRPR